MKYLDFILKIHVRIYQIHKAFSKLKYYNRFRFYLRKIKTFGRITDYDTRRHSMVDHCSPFRRIWGTSEFFRNLLDHGGFSRKENSLRLLWEYESNNLKTLLFQNSNVVKFLPKNEVAFHIHKFKSLQHECEVFELEDLCFDGDIFYTHNCFLDIDEWSSPKHDSSYGKFNPVFCGYVNKRYALAVYPKARFRLPDSKFVYIFGRYVDNYWHFICEYFPRLLQVSNNQTVLIPKNMIVEFQKVLIDYLLYKQISFQFIPQGVYEIPSTSFITSPVQHKENQIFSIDQELIQKFSNDFLEFQSSELDIFGNKYMGKVVYLVRQSPRRLVYDKHLINLIKDFPVTIVNPEALSLSEQVALFRNAKAIIGYPGANWANVIFAHSKLRVYNIVNDTLAAGSLHKLMAKISGCTFVDLHVTSTLQNLNCVSSYSEIDNAYLYISPQSAEQICNYIFQDLSGF